jgi:hypothetical protein
VALSRNERRQFATIVKALSQDRDFAARMTPGRPLQRRFLTALFYAGMVMTLVGFVVAQLAPGGIALCFYGVISVLGALLGHRRMVTGMG